MTSFLSNARRLLPVWMGIPLGVALGMRLFFYTGLQVGDDLAYGGYADALRNGLYHLEEGQHALRFGMLLPIAASLALFGGSEFVLTLFNLLCSLGCVGLSSCVGHRLAGPRAGLLAGLLLAVLPCSIYCGTEITPDVPIALALSLSSVLLLCASDREPRAARGLLLAAGIVCGFGHLTREMAFFFFALAALEARVRRRWDLLVVPMMAFGVVVVGELSFYAVATGDPLYRVHAVQKMHVGRIETVIHDDSALWYAPFLVLFRELDWYGLHYFLFIPAVLSQLFRRERSSGFLFRWWGVLFLLLAFWPVRLSPYTRALPPGARFYEPLLVPSAVIVALMFERWSSRWRLGVLSAAVGVAVLCNVVLHHNRSIRPFTVRASHEFVREKGKGIPVVSDGSTTAGFRFLEGYRPNPSLKGDDPGDSAEFLLVWDEGMLQMEKDVAGVDEKPVLEQVLRESESTVVFETSAPRSVTYRTVFSARRTKEGNGVRVYRCRRRGTP